MDLFLVYDGCIIKINLCCFFNFRRIMIIIMRIIVRVIFLVVVFLVINGKLLEFFEK